MSPLLPGDPGDGHGEDGDDGGDDPVEFRPPLPPEDRIWRHPSEVAAARAPAAPVPSGGGRLVAVGVVAALIGATLSLGVVAVAGGFDRETRLVERQVAVQPVTDLATEAETVAAITSRTAPALAALRVERDGVSVVGTAVAYRSDGHLLTNAHLVVDADAIDVQLHDGSVVSARLVGVDEVTDVAVLHVDGGSPLGTAALGSADPLRVGDRTIAIATADGNGWAPVVATGVVSALGRRLQVDVDRVLHDLIVVDVPLTGAGGGVLVDAHGAVVGLTTDLPSATDLGMATPIDLVRRVADDLIDHGRARHVWLGIEGTDLELAEAKDRHLDGGAIIRRIVDASPAAAAGLVAGDVVVRIDDERVQSMGDLIAALRHRSPGEVVVLAVHRDGEELDLSLELVERS